MKVMVSGFLGKPPRKFISSSPAPVTPAALKAQHAIENAERDDVAATKRLKFMDRLTTPALSTLVEWERAKADRKNRRKKIEKATAQDPL